MDLITPCVWFDSQAEEAAQFYTSVFENSKITQIAHYGKAGARMSGKKEGSVMMASFQLAGQSFLGINGGPATKPTPAVSFFVSCESEKELDTKWEKLSHGGEIRMALAKYPWSEKYGWCKDKYGVDWQLILSPGKKQKISPAILFVKNNFSKAEEAIKFYTSVFKGSEIKSISKDETTKAVVHSSFSLNGYDIVLMESPMKEHKFEITWGISLMVNCYDQSEIDYYWNKLSQGGMELPCGWLSDKFGLSWQVTPAQLEEIAKDPVKHDRFMSKMGGMKKLDWNVLKDAIEKTQSP